MIEEMIPEDAKRSMPSPDLLLPGPSLALITHSTQYVPLCPCRSAILKFPSIRDGNS